MVRLIIAQNTDFVNRKWAYFITKHKLVGLTNLLQQIYLDIS